MKPECPVCGSIQYSAQSQCTRCGHWREFCTTPEADLKYQSRIQTELQQWQAKQGIEILEKVQAEIARKEIVEQACLDGSTILKNKRISGVSIQVEKSLQNQKQMPGAGRVADDFWELTWPSIYLKHMIRRVNLERILAKEARLEQNDNSETSEWGRE